VGWRESSFDSEAAAAATDCLSSRNCSEQLWCPPSLLFNGYYGLSTVGLKQAGHRADHSPPSSTKHKMCYTQTLPYSFTCVQADNFLYSYLYLVIKLLTKTLKTTFYHLSHYGHKWWLIIQRKEHKMEVHI